MRYTLHDDQTGRAVTIEADRPPTLAEQEQVYQKAGLRGTTKTQAPQEKPTNLALQGSQGISNILRGVGLGVIPDYMALTSGQAVQKYADVNPYTNEGSQSRFQQTPFGQVPSLKTVGADAAGAASWAVPVGAGAGLLARLGLRGILPKIAGYAATGLARGEGYGLSQGQTPTEALPGAALGAVAEPLSLIRPFLTKGGLAKKTEQIASEATREGKSLNFDDLAKQIREGSFSKFGKTSETRSLTDKLIAELTPGDIASYTPPDLERGIAAQYAPQTETLTPSKLLELRRQATARSGTNWFKKMIGGSDLEDKIANEGRRVLSKNLHELAPGTKVPDWLYNKYSNKLIGSPLRLLLEATIGSRIPSAYKALLPGQ